MIIDYVRKIVGWISIGLDQDHIVQLFVRLGNITINLIMECRHALIRHIGTDNIRLACCQIRLDLLLGQMETMLVICSDLLAANVLLQRLKTFFITETVISLALGDQLLGIFHIKAALTALALDVRTIATILVRTFIMLESGLLQSTVNDLQCFIKKTLLISIFYSKYKVAALMLDDQIGVQRRS